MTVSSPCAVLYAPDATWIARQKKKGNAEDFYTVADDMQFYANQTSEYLARHHIKVIDTQAAWIRFKQGPQLIKEVDLRNSAYGWGLLLFNGHDAPMEADLTSPENDVRTVFHK